MRLKAISHRFRPPAAQQPCLNEANLSNRCIRSRSGLLCQPQEDVPELPGIDCSMDAQPDSSLIPPQLWQDYQGEEGVGQHITDRTPPADLSSPHLEAKEASIELKHRLGVQVAKETGPAYAADPART
jgi:hypothetical protein